jgi:hypothetical protein
MHLSNDQKLWLLTAHPDTWELGDEAPGWLIDQCVAKGLVAGDPRKIMKLTPVGHQAWRRLRGEF